MTQEIDPMDPADLRSLWQSDARRAETDPEDVLRRIEEAERHEGRVFWGGCAGGAIVLLIVLVLETSGLSTIPGLLTGLIGAALAWHVIRHVSRPRVPATASLPPGRLLSLALDQARQSLRAARLAYAGLPAGVAVGMLMAPLLAAPGSDLGWSWTLRAVVLVILAALVGAAMVWGVRRAGRMQREIRELEYRLRDMET